MSSYSDFIDAYLPAGYWRLGEASGPTAVDRGVDLHDGTYINTPTYSATSLIPGDDGGDTAVTFASGSSEDVNIGDFHDFSFNNPATFCFWVKTTSTTASALISKVKALPFAEGYAISMTASGYLTWGCWAHTATNGLRVRSTEAPINDGNAHCVMCVNTGATGANTSGIHIYVDGVEVATVDELSFADTASSTTGVLSFAGDHQNTLNFFTGTLDEVFVKRTAFTADDAVWIFEAGTGVITPVLAEGLTTASTLISQLSKTITEAVEFDDATGIIEFIVESVNAADSIVTLRNLIGIAAEILELTATEDTNFAKSAIEGLALNETWVGSTILQGSFGDTFTVADVIVLTWDLLQTETINIADDNAVYARRISTIAETLVLAGVVSTIHKAAGIIAEVLILQDLAGRFFGESVTEDVDLSDDFVAVYRAIVETVEETTYADSSGSLHKISLLISENLTKSDATDINQVVVAAITEGATFGGTIVLPDGVFSAIVLNTESLGISEYDNYPFNSFGKLGADYLGASDTNIYQLSGGDDAGTDIDAVIKTGLTNFGTNLFKRVPRAYLGYTSDGGLILKTISTSGGTKVERWYELTPRTGDHASDAHAAARIVLGRGIKATYWQFELINKSGADFDIDSLQLFPMVLSRRV